MDEILPKALRSSSQERLAFVKPYFEFEKRLQENFPGLSDDELDQSYEFHWDTQLLPFELGTAAGRMFRYCARHVLERTIAGRVVYDEYEAFLSRLRTAIVREIPLLFRKYRCGEAYIRARGAEGKSDLLFEEFSAALNRTIDHEYREFWVAFLESMAKSELGKEQEREDASRTGNSLVGEAHCDARHQEIESPVAAMIKAVDGAQRLMRSADLPPVFYEIERIRRTIDMSIGSNATSTAIGTRQLPDGPDSSGEPVQFSSLKDRFRATRRAAIDAYIEEVRQKAGKTITRTDIWKDAGYTHRREFEGWQRGEAKPGSAVDVAIRRVLQEKHDISLGR